MKFNKFLNRLLPMAGVLVLTLALATSCGSDGNDDVLQDTGTEQNGSDGNGGNSGGSQTNPMGPLVGSTRVCRGGGWDDAEWNFTTRYRFADYSPSSSDKSIGFRLAITNW